MSRRSSSLTNNTVTGIDREIGSQYDNVKLVSEHLDAIAIVSDGINSGIFDEAVTVVSDPLASAIVAISPIADSVTAVANAQADISTLLPYLDDLAVISADIDGMLAAAAEVAAIADEITTVATNAVNVQTVAANMADIQVVTANIAEVLLADDNAAIATAKADEATASAATASALVDEIHNLSAVATDLASGEAATATYDSGTGVLTLGIPAGLAGAAGSTGDSAYDIAIAAGFVGTEEEWLNSLVGPQGIQGEIGPDGLTAYEVATNAGFVGTEAEWLATLVGPKGDKGDTGAGLVTKGTDTAANIQLKSGVEGDFWIASDTGDGWSYVSGAWVNTGQIQGIQGEQGIQGIQGETGPQGPQGETGDALTLNSVIDNLDGTFTWNFSDGNSFTTSDLTGPQGIQGPQGETGNGIASITRTSGDGSAGTTSTYTITYTDATTSIFQVYNGADGAVVSVAGKQGDVTLVEADITDLDKYTKAEVNAALAQKQDAGINPVVAAIIFGG